MALGISRLKLAISSVIAISLLLLVTTLTGRFASIDITGRTVEVIRNCTTALEPFAFKIPYDYVFKYSIANSEISEDKSDQGFIYRGIVKIINQEIEDGSFTVKVEFKTPSENVPQKSTKIIGGNSVQAFEFIYTAPEDQKASWSFAVEPAVEKRYKEETVYRNVEICS